MRAQTLADKAGLSGIRKLIRSELSEAGAPPAHAFDCLVAVTEACTNALVHGKGETDSPDPEVLWEIDEECARFLIKDFSQKQKAIGSHPSTERERTLRKVRAVAEGDGGFGLDMMRNLMDEVDIQFGPRGTTVSLTKHFD